MKISLIASLAALTLPLSAQLAEAKDLCTLIDDLASGKHLVEQGDCTNRVTPASTFKLPLALMGADAGFITSPHEPVLNIKKGEPDWGGENWRVATNPTHWMKYSVVWYSQRIAKHLGAEKLTAYAKSFGLGNADMSGDKAKNNGLERSWISSSLKISPVEQAAFIRKLLNKELPVSPEARQIAMSVTQQFDAGSGWTVHGKTGSAMPRNKDGSFRRGNAWGWFVGWAQKNDRKIIFAKLIQDEVKQDSSAGLRARDQFLAELPKLIP